jgi:transglutaminase-like putative cysteine protease
MNARQTRHDYLMPTAILDCDTPAVREYAAHAIGSDATSALEKAVRLYYQVRDGIWYDPYSPFHLAEHYRASNVIASGKGYCVSKAALLCALARTAGIPARLGFADVRNHLTTRQLQAYMGSNLFVFHGFTELFLQGKWVIATPAFNIELCERHGVAALEFDGQTDSLFQPYSLKKEKHMEYVRKHGSYSDVPINVIVSAWKAEYGEERVEQWIRFAETHPGQSIRDFFKEDVISE